MANHDIDITNTLQIDLAVVREPNGKVSQSLVLFKHNKQYYLYLYQSGMAYMNIHISKGLARQLRGSKQWKKTTEALKAGTK